MSEPRRLTLTQPPAELPLGLGETKAYLGLGEDETAHDALLAGYIRSATEACQAFTQRALITQQWRLALDAWPSTPGVELPLPPLQAVVQVLAYDELDQATEWPAASYFVDTASAPGRLVARDGLSLPLAMRAANAIAIDFRCGYGDRADDVPQPLRDGLLAFVAALHDCGGTLDGAEASRASGAAALWRPYRLLRL